MNGSSLCRTPGLLSLDADKRAIDVTHRDMGI